MSDWKQNGKYPESMFAINFRETYPQIAEQMLKNGSWELGKEVTVDGYKYKAKEVTAKKDGKKYTFVERVKVQTLGEDSPEQVAADKTRKEYQDGAKKGHEENIAMHKESMTAIENLTEAIRANTDRVAELIQKLDKVMKV